ncbi:MAG: ABC-2 family transporter protein [Spirochaetales bacterium]|nr:ABC-2 family transporter protein [Spirochaetales bacterium]
MARYLRLYLRYFGQNIKSLMSYRLSFLVGLAAFMARQFLGVAFVGLVFAAIPDLAGWSRDEVLFVYGFAQLGRGFDHMFTDNLWILAWRMVARGEFDRILVRPLPPLFQLLAERFQTDGIGELVAGIAVTAWTAPRLDFPAGPWSWALGAIAVVASFLIYTAVKLALASLAFWIKFSQAYLFAAYKMADFAMYPMNIYPKALRFVLSWALPFAFTAYYPAAALLGRESVAFGIGLALAVGLVATALSLAVWRAGLRAYESAGS